MHRTPQNRRGCIIFWRSNALIEEVARILTWNSHSRSFILQSVIGWQCVAYSHDIACRISVILEDVSHLNRQKLPSSTTPNFVWRSRPREPPQISAWTLYFQQLESLAYIFVANSMGLSSFKFVQWAPKDRVLAENGFWRQIAAQGHWRSFILQSYRPRRGSMSPL